MKSIGNGHSGDFAYQYARIISNHNQTDAKQSQLQKTSLSLRGEQ